MARKKKTRTKGTNGVVRIPEQAREKLLAAVRDFEVAQREMARIQVDYRLLLEVPDTYVLGWTVDGTERVVAFLEPEHPDLVAAQKAAAEAGR